MEHSGKYEVAQESDEIFLKYISLHEEYIFVS